eukprot:m.303503 g.303503  ORF g.303503 m.303503 type:complete len:121 (-) comp27301_c0_seq1:610-972(-)
MASTTDYRLTGEHTDQIFMHPLSAENRATAAELFQVLTKGEVVGPTSLATQGRIVRVSEAAETTRTARFRWCWSPCVEHVSASSFPFFFGEARPCPTELGSRSPPKRLLPQLNHRRLHTF